jgi:hypothetical protein
VEEAAEVEETEVAGAQPEVAPQAAAEAEPPEAPVQPVQADES